MVGQGSGNRRGLVQEKVMSHQGIRFNPLPILHFYDLLEGESIQHSIVLYHLAQYRNASILLTCPTLCLLSTSQIETNHAGRTTEAALKDPQFLFQLANCA